MNSSHSGKPLRLFAGMLTACKNLHVFLLVFLLINDEVSSVYPFFLNKAVIVRLLFSSNSSIVRASIINILAAFV